MIEQKLNGIEQIITRVCFHQNLDKLKNADHREVNNQKITE